MTGINKALHRHVVKFLDILQGSLLGRVYVKIRPLMDGSSVVKVFRALHIRGVMLITLALYLPLDAFLRIVAPAAISSVWDEGILILFGVYALFRGARLSRKSRVSVLDAAIVLFIGYMLLNMLGNSRDMSIGIAGFRAIVQSLMWFFVALRLFENKRDVYIFFGAFAIMCVGLALHGVYQYIIKVPVPANWVTKTESAPRTRVFSIVGSPNILGDLMILAIPICAAFGYVLKSIRLKIIAWGGAALCCMTLLFTFTRGAWAGAAVALLIFVICQDRRLFFLLLGGGISATIIMPSIISRLLFVFTPAFEAANSIAGRGYRWEYGLDLLRSNPLFGVGLGRFGGAVAMNTKPDARYIQYFYLDNYYLKTAVESGYVGMAIFIALMAFVVIWGIRVCSSDRTPRQPKILAKASLAGICGVLLHCYSENIFEVPYMGGYFWSIAAAVIFIGFFCEEKKSG